MHWFAIADAPPSTALQRSRSPVLKTALATEIRNRPQVRWAGSSCAVALEPPELLQQFTAAFDVPFAEFDLSTGELNHVAAGWLCLDLDRWIPLLEEVVSRERVQIVEDCAPLAVLAVPMPEAKGGWCTRLALATFVTQPFDPDCDLTAAARAVGVDQQVLQRWCQGQAMWPTRAVEQLSHVLVQQHAAKAENEKLKHQLTNVSQHLLQTFDELNLLHRINERLSLSNDEAQLLELAIEWLSNVLPAECVLARISPSGSEHDGQSWIYAGECPIDEAELDQFFDRLGPDACESTVLIDHETTCSPTWYYPTVREAISVPIRAGHQVTGWLLAVNHVPDAGRPDEEFGNLETSLLSSVASMLGMHAGNVKLYNDQSHFFESVVRALSSAIDAKDPYTQGHSERVARISVLLARHLGCTPDELNTIYLSGLLHDIGKIGIEDHILQKPGELTAEEFEHIKLHPEMGHRILAGIEQLRHVLPVVLHHHEAWDGSGYPHGLAGKQIPWLARIVAVADSFDAMSSDRPYRTGMPSGQLNEVFQSGSEHQWDPQVVDAFFAIRDEIDAVLQEDRELLSLDVLQWSK